jgi:hypothetical protein
MRHCFRIIGLEGKSIYNAGPAAFLVALRDMLQQHIATERVLGL